MIVHLVQRGWTVSRGQKSLVIIADEDHFGKSGVWDAAIDKPPVS